MVRIAKSGRHSRAVVFDRPSSECFDGQRKQVQEFALSLHSEKTLRLWRVLRDFVPEIDASIHHADAEMH
jgi:hypothetical protein